MHSFRHNRLLLLSMLLVIIMVSAACSKKNDDTLNNTSDPISTNEDNGHTGDNLSDSSKDSSADASSSGNSNPSDGPVRDFEASKSSIDYSDSPDGTTGDFGSPTSTEDNSDHLDSSTGNSDRPTSTEDNSDKTGGSTSKNSNSETGSTGYSGGLSEGKETKGTKKTRVIAIDAGHQSKGNYQEEPIGPGAKKTKPKVTSGTQGISTGVPEYKLTLVIAKKVQEELINRGYEVVMIRESHDVNLSNRERAEIANESGADLFLRIHADSFDNPEVNGVSTLYPSKKNPYVSKLSKSSYALSKAIVDEICDSTKAKNRGAIARDDMSGINWCTIPVSIIEMGYLSNKTEDEKMQTKDYQNQIVEGICNGIDDYYESEQ